MQAMESFGWIALQQPMLTTQQLLQHVKLFMRLDAGLEWEEVEASEGPALLNLHASTATAQVCSTCPQCMVRLELMPTTPSCYDGSACNPPAGQLHGQQRCRSG